MSAVLPKNHIKGYVLGGRAVVTIFNTTPKVKSVSQFVYTVKASKYLGWNVYHSGSYLGHIHTDHILKLQENFKVDTLYGQAKEVFAWFWQKLMTDSIPNNIRVYHSGYCGKCGRLLTDAVSLETGFGPECRRKLGIKVN